MSDDSMAESQLRSGVANSDLSLGEDHSLVLQPSRPRLIRIQARGEEFPILQIHGQLFVCSKANGNCCCGWEEKGRAPVNAALYEAEWERRGLRSRLHLSFTGCLGVCTLGNNALLQILGRSIWLKDLNDDALVPAIFDYAEAMLDLGRIMPPLPSLKAHVYERFLAPPTGEHLPLMAEPEPALDDVQNVDPVCFMKVDTATARHVAEFQGRTIYFCAPSCKRQFLANPAAFTVG